MSRPRLALGGRPRGLLLALLDLLAPPSCPCCDAEVPAAGLCARCERSLVALPPSACRRCGLVPRQRGRCPRCRRRRFAFDSVTAPLRYRGAARDLLLRAKFGREPLALAPFVEPMARAARRSGPLRRCDLVTWIPLSWRRRLVRGFDQAEWLAAALARRLGRERRATLRRGHRAPLSRLGARERRRAVEGDFGLRRGAERALAGRSVLLVDDVVTTGATCDEAARVLKRGGARDVRVLAAAVA